MSSAGDVDGDGHADVIVGQPNRISWIGPGLAKAWSTRIGEGSGRKHRITAVPVVAGGRVYTLDSRSQLSAVTTSGAPLWSVSLAPASESRP